MEESPSGNVTPKRHLPVLRSIQARLDRAVVAACRGQRAKRLLDVGCGEGELTEQLARTLPDGEVLGLDRPSKKLDGCWKRIDQPNLTFVTGSATDLPFGDDEFDVVTAIEVLEHIRDWSAALDEIARVCSRLVVASVPHEPYWRYLNMARLAYLDANGNTPGHVNHWSRRDFRRVMEQRFVVRAVRSIFPWTLVVAEVQTRMAPAGRDLDASR